jgi:hypothetical protein
MSKDELRVYEEAVEKRIQNLKAMIAQYEENDFSKYLDLKLAVVEVSNIAKIFNENLEWDYLL